MEEKGKAGNVPNELSFKSKNDEEKHIPIATYDRDEEWVREYIKQFGEEPSFF